jgi:hypothetical protein
VGAIFLEIGTLVRKLFILSNDTDGQSNKHDEGIEVLSSSPIYRDFTFFGTEKKTTASYGNSFLLCEGSLPVMFSGG